MTFCEFFGLIESGRGPRVAAFPRHIGRCVRTVSDPTLQGEALTSNDSAA